jgi:HEAT repeat protein
VQLLGDRDASVRNDAALQLGAEFGEKGGRAVPTLVKALWDEDVGSITPMTAAEALGRIGPAARQAVPALIALLASRPEAGIQSGAVEALGLMGTPARRAVPVLLERLKHPDGLVRVHAALALWRIDRKRDGLPVALAGLHDRNYRARITAAEALWATKRDNQAISALLDALAEAARRNHRNPANVRYMVARALGRIGPSAREATTVLRHLLEDENEDVRGTAAWALKAVTAKPAGGDKEP